MVSHHPAKFGAHRQCGIGNLFLVVEEQDSTSSRINPLLLFIFKAHGLKAQTISC